MKSLIASNGLSVQELSDGSLLIEDFKNNYVNKLAGSKNKSLYVILQPSDLYDGSLSIHDARVYTATNEFMSKKGMRPT